MTGDAPAASGFLLAPVPAVCSADSAAISSAVKLLKRRDLALALKALPPVALSLAAVE